MTKIDGAARGDLLGDMRPDVESLADGATVLRGFATSEAESLIAAVEQIAAVAPFRNMITPGGYRMSVAMTNCGGAGWVTDRSGYRYDPRDPETGQPWPAMPKRLSLSPPAPPPRADTRVSRPTRA